MQIGRYRLRSVVTGGIALDGGAMFGVVPRTLWQQALPPDEHNRVHLAMRALLIEELDGPVRILVDTGAGEEWSDKHRAIYGLDGGGIASGLATHGLSTDDITDVLLTHLHFDHAGGATRRDGDRLVPTFGNARYWVQRRNWEWAQQPSDKDRASYRPNDFVPLREHGVLELLDGPGTFRPGIELLLSEGHTTAMQLPLLRGDEGVLAYCADLVPTAAHVPVPWVMSYDNQPLITIDEKKALLAEAARGGWLLFLEHDPRTAAIRLALDAERGAAVVAEHVDL